VFTPPGAFDSRHPLGFQSLEITTEEEGEQETFSLQWARLPGRSFQYGCVLEGIANADHAQTPSVSGRVYFLNPATAMIAHMYDDRGLDMIAASSGYSFPACANERNRPVYAPEENRWISVYCVWVSSEGPWSKISERNA